MNKTKLFNIKQYDKKTLFRLFVIIFIVIPGIPFILATFGLLAYSFWPRDFSDTTDFSIEKNAQYITLSAHGVKDSPASWSVQLQSAMSLYSPVQLEAFNQQYISIDWQKFSTNVFICSVAGKNIGFEIGKRIATETNIKGVHVIGHSCGAFITLGLCQGIKSVNSTIIVQTTYLDPVSVYGGIFWNYGLKHFGSCADFSDSYIDREDGVPGSDQALQHSVTFDVTEIRRNGKYNIAPHVWPTAYYIDAYKNTKVPIRFNSTSKMENSFPQPQMIKDHSN